MSRVTHQTKNIKELENHFPNLGSTFKTYVCKCKHKLRENYTKK